MSNANRVRGPFNIQHSTFNIQHLLLTSALLAFPLLAQETRIASDYEIRTMQAQAAGAKDFSTQVFAHLNLGDLRMTRNEQSLAEQEYATALQVAETTLLIEGVIGSVL